MSRTLCQYARVREDTTYLSDYQRGYLTGQAHAKGNFGYEAPHTQVTTTYTCEAQAFEPHCPHKGDPWYCPLRRDDTDKEDNL